MTCCLLHFGHFQTHELPREPLLNIARPQHRGDAELFVDEALMNPILPTPQFHRNETTSPTFETYVNSSTHRNSHQTTPGRNRVKPPHRIEETTEST